MLARSISFPNLARCRAPSLPSRNALLVRTISQRTQSTVGLKRQPSPLSRESYKPVPTSGKVPPYLSQFFDKLLKKNSPTILYRAPSQTGYITFAYVNGIFLLTTAAVIYSEMVLHAPSGLAWWVPFVYKIISASMVVLGGYAILRASNLVARVVAVPTNGVLRFHIESKRLFPMPLVPRKTFNVLPDVVEMESTRVTAADLPHAIIKDTSSSEGVTSAPSVTSRLRGFLSACLRSQRRVITQKGFAYIAMKDRWGLWKIDLLDGEVHREVANLGKWLSQERHRNPLLR